MSTEIGKKRGRGFVEPQSNHLLNYLPKSHFAVRVQEYVEQHLAESLTLEKVAKHMYVSPCHLSRVFKKAAGCTFVQYVSTCRLERAKELLTRTEHSMEHIAAECGFRTASYFPPFFAVR